jgi:DNA modification methylase
MKINNVYESDVSELIKQMPNNFIDRVITSPPYNIARNYIEYRDAVSADEFINWQVNLFNDLNRTIKPKGLIIYNFSYGQEDPLLPFALISSIDAATEWTVVDTIIWKKPNATPVNSNRLTRIVEFIFVFARKSEVKTFDRNKEYSKKGDLTYKYTRNFIEAPNNDGIEVPLNEAVFSTELILKLLAIYVDYNHLVYDPFCGLGTTIRACILYGCNYIGSDLSWRQVNYFNNKRLPAIKRNIEKLIEFYSDLNIELKGKERLTIKK